MDAETVARAWSELKKRGQYQNGAFDVLLEEILKLLSKSDIENYLEEGVKKVVV